MMDADRLVDIPFIYDGLRITASDYTEFLSDGITSDI